MLDILVHIIYALYYSAYTAVTWTHRWQNSESTFVFPAHVHSGSTGSALCTLSNTQILVDSHEDSLTQILLLLTASLHKQASHHYSLADESVSCCGTSPKHPTSVKGKWMRRSQRSYEEKAKTIKSSFTENSQDSQALQQWQEMTVQFVSQEWFPHHGSFCWAALLSNGQQLDTTKLYSNVHWSCDQSVPVHKRNVTLIKEILTDLIHTDQSW